MMLVLSTDFGLEGPYLGQVRAVLAAKAPGIPVIDLFADLPTYQPRAASFLLPAYTRAPFPIGTVHVCVVDPGVGTERRAVIARIDGRWYVAPDNGLLHAVVATGQRAEAWEVLWRPDQASSSFHGRDIFAPVAAALACGVKPGQTAPLRVKEIPAADLCRPDWATSLAEVIYFDRFGNAMTGLRGDACPADRLLTVRGRSLPFARTFGLVAAGQPFWYVNSNGLVEIAVNGGSARDLLGLVVGDRINWKSA